MKEILKQFEKVCPIEWDRFTKSKHETTCFGWIARSDGGKDFIVLNFSNDAVNAKDVWFCTSSAKYLERFAKATNQSHTQCTPFNLTP